MAVLGILLSLAGFISFTRMNHIYRERQVQNIKETYASILDMENDTLMNDLRSLRVQANDYLHKDTTISLSLTGVRKTDLKVLDVTLALSKFVQENDWTDYACLHVLNGDHVMTSDQKILAMQDWTNPELFEQKPDLSNLIWYENHLYELLRYPEERPLLELAVRIDHACMQRALDKTSYAEHAMWLYYDGNPVLGQDTTQREYPLRKDLQVTNREAFNNTMFTGDSTTSNQKVFSYVSQDSGLQWVAFVPDSELELPARSLLKILFPVFNTVLFLMLAGSLFLVRLVYRPMEDTLSSVITASNHQISLPHSANELELIREVCQQMEIRQETMRNMLSQVSTAIEERLLKSLLAGEEVNDSELKATLADASPDFRMEGIFQIIILTAYYGPDRICPLREQELHRWTIEQSVREFWSATSTLYSFDGPNNEKILLLRHPEDYSVRTARHLTTDFELMLQELEKKLNLHLEFGSGYNFHNLTDLYDARQDAEKNLQERLYYRRGHENSEAIWLRYSKKAEEMLQAELTSPGQYSRNIRLLIQEAMSVPENAPVICSRICNVILERLIQLNVTVNDDWLSFRRNLEEHQEPLIPTDDRYLELEHFLDTTLQALENAAGDEKYHYIENARRYIETHYNDCNLSLNTVSDYCGISSSYLSRLFTSYMPPGFVEYLNQYRIRQAEHLLLSTSYTIVEIGFKTGFNSPQNFSRVFKKYHGKTPGQFRTQGKETV